MNKPLYKKGQTLLLSKQDGADAAIVLNVLQIKDIPDPDNFMMFYYSEMKDRILAYKTKKSWEAMQDEESYIYELLLGNVKGYFHLNKRLNHVQVEDSGKSFITVAERTGLSIMNEAVDRGYSFIGQRSKLSEVNELYENLKELGDKTLPPISFKPPKYMSTHSVGIEPPYADTYVRRVDFRSKINTPIQGPDSSAFFDMKIVKQRK